MDIQQFQILSDAEKEECVWKNGIFLANYDEGTSLCDAYQLFDFYVAFCYDLSLNKDAVISIHLSADELPHLLKIQQIF